MRFLGATRGWALAVLIAARMTLVAAAGVLVIAPITGCDSVDPKTPEGIRHALETGEKVDEAIKNLESSSAQDRAAVGDAIHKRYMDGDPDHGDALLGFLMSINDAKYADAYIKGLQDAKPERIPGLASIVLALKLEQAEDALIEAYRRAKDADAHLAILQAGLAINSEKIAQLAVSIFEGVVTDTPAQKVEIACKLLAAHPQPEVNFKIAPFIFLKVPGQPGQPAVASPRITEACSRALKALGDDAVPVIEKVLDDDHGAVEALLKRNSYYLSRADVFGQMISAINVLRDPALADELIEIIAKPERVAELPVDLQGDINQGLQGGWAGGAAVIYQDALLALTHLDVPDEHHDAAREALMDLFRWGNSIQRKFKTIAGYVPALPEIYGYLAIQLLVEQDLLTDEITKEIIDFYAKPMPGEDPQMLTERVLRIRMGGDLLNTLAIIAPHDVEPVLITPIKTALEAELQNELLREKFTPGDFEKPEKQLAQIEPALAVARACKDDDSCYSKAFEEAMAAHLEEAASRDNPEDRTNDDEASQGESEGEGNAATPSPTRAQTGDSLALLRAVHEVGKRGIGEHFEAILDDYVNFPEIHRLNALRRLARPEHVPLLEAAIAKAYARNSRVGKNLEPVFHDLILRARLAGE